VNGEGERTLLSVGGRRSKGTLNCTFGILGSGDGDRKNVIGSGGGIRSKRKRTFSGAFGLLGSGDGELPKDDCKLDVNILEDPNDEDCKLDPEPELSPFDDSELPD
jgi:hypothetical protein